jgi:hypothetical protein
MPRGTEEGIEVRIKTYDAPARDQEDLRMPREDTMARRPRSAV